MISTKCFSCKASVPNITGVTHPYILSSPGCWKLYSEVLAKEYNPAYFDTYIHRITVDSYAVTHPGDKNDNRAVRSVNIHLMSLYHIFEKKTSDDQLLKFIRKAADHNNNLEFNWLSPPDFSKTLKITDVLTAIIPAEHKKTVYNWGMSVWSTWKIDHGTTIKNLVERVE